MTKNQRIWVVGVAVGVIVLIGWLIYQGRQENSGAVKIGAIFPLTGPNASYGEQASQAIKLALASVNAGGGIGGKPLEVVYQDSQFQSTPALSAYQQLTTQGVHFFLTIGSQVAVTVEPKVRADGNLQYELTAVTPKYRDGSPLTCRSALTADASSPVLANYLKTHDLLHVATFVSNDEQGTAVENTLGQATAAFGGTIVDKEKYQTQDNDFRTQITNLKAVNPDALVVVAPGQYAETLFRQLKELGFNKPIFSNNWTIENQSLRDLSQVEGVIFTDFAYQSATSSDDSPGTANFKNEFQQATGQNPPIVSANAYDAIMVLSDAFKSVGQDSQKVATHITGLKNYQGVSGNLSFDRDCEAAQGAILKVVHQGKFEPAI